MSPCGPQVLVRDIRVGSSCHHADPKFLCGMLEWRARVTMRTPGSCAGFWGGELVSPCGPKVLVRDAGVESLCHHADPRFLCGMLGWRARVTTRTPGSCAGCWGGELMSPRGPQVQVSDARVGSSRDHADPRFWCGMLGWGARVTMRTPGSGRDNGVESSCHHADPRFLCGMLGWRARVTTRTPGSCVGCWGGELVSPCGPQVLVRDVGVESLCHHEDPSFWCGMLGWRALLLAVLVHDAGVESSLS